MGGHGTVIVGAGIGGLTAALALSNHGRSVTLLERRTGFEEVGAGIQISPNASRVLIELGVGAALRRVAAEPSRVVVRSIDSGREIGEAALGSFARERFGAPYCVIHRADLQTVLLDAVRARDNVRILLGRTAIEVESGLDLAHVRVEKAGGAAETLTADLVVGADGLHSKVRRALGVKSEPVYQGYTAWRATVPAEAMPRLSDETGLWLGRKGHVVHYPIKSGRLLNIVAIERRTTPVEGWSAPGDGRELLDRFRSAVRPLRDLLARPQEWLLWSLFDLPVSRMAFGRVALVGDAAHPVLPFLAQGGALAIEDAAILAQALGQNCELPEALACYEAARIRRVRRVQDAARRNGAAFHAAGMAALVRNAIIGRLGPEGMTARYAWIYGWRPEPPAPCAAQGTSVSLKTWRTWRNR